MSSITVMIVDDSALLHQVLTEQPASGGIEINGVASDPSHVGTALQAQWPDVIVLQLGLAGMDGVALLKQILAERPTPIVVAAPPDRGRRRVGAGRPECRGRVRSDPARRDPL